MDVLRTCIYRNLWPPAITSLLTLYLLSISFFLYSLFLSLFLSLFVSPLHLFLPIFSPFFVFLLLLATVLPPCPPPCLSLPSLFLLSSFLILLLFSTSLLCWFFSLLLSSLPLFQLSLPSFSPCYCLPPLSSYFLSLLSSSLFSLPLSPCPSPLASLKSFNLFYLLL